MNIHRLTEADKQKARFFSWIKDTEKREELISLYCRQEVPNNIIDWQRIKNYSVEELEKIVKDFLKAHKEKKNQKRLSKALEGRDYIKVFENTTSNGTEYLYLPLTWLGSKYLASDHFLPKIKVPSKVMNANDFSDNTSKNEDLSPGAKWCISLWTIPDLVIDGKPVTDENGKELRHEGKRYWLEYTSEGAYFLFYFRDIKRLKDTYKKRALTLKQGSPKILDVTLADDTEGVKNSNIKRVQDYWREHYQEYESQIEHIQEVSTKDKPEFKEYEKQKEQKAIDYYNSQMREAILKNSFTYNESTGRYDSNSILDIYTLRHIIKDGEFTVPLGVIDGGFNCSGLGLKTLKNGPTEVTGNFNCSFNSLMTLEYAPKRVGGYFDCRYNNLTTLEGAPQIIERNFYCFHNNLTTLEGSPKYVEGDFNCSYNELTTLKGAPEYVGGNFNYSNNPLQSKELPTEVG